MWHPSTPNNMLLTLIFDHKNKLSSYSHIIGNVCKVLSKYIQRFTLYLAHTIISTYVHCDLDLSLPLTFKTDFVYSFALLTKSTKFAEYSYNIVVSIVFTRSKSDTQTHPVAAPQKCFFVFFATCCARIIKPAHWLKILPVLSCRMPVYTIFGHRVGQG